MILKKCAANKIIARRANLAAWFETWWQILRYSMCSKKNSIFLYHLLLQVTFWHYCWT